MICPNIEYFPSWSIFPLSANAFALRRLTETPDSYELSTLSQALSTILLKISDGIKCLDLNKRFAILPGTSLLTSEHLSWRAYQALACLIKSLHRILMSLSSFLAIAFSEPQVNSFGWKVIGVSAVTDLPFDLAILSSYSTSIESSWGVMFLRSFKNFFDSSSRISSAS